MDIDEGTKGISGEPRSNRESGEGAVGNSMTWVVRPDPDLEDLIPSFLSNRNQDIADLRQAIERKDYDWIRRTAHTLKGICRPYGFTHLETLSQQLEAAGQAEDLAQISGVVLAMQNYLENVRIVYEP